MENLETQLSMSLAIDKYLCISNSELKIIL